MVEDDRGKLFEAFSGQLRVEQNHSVIFCRHQAAQPIFVLCIRQNKLRCKFHGKARHFENVAEHVQVFQIKQVARVFLTDNEQLAFGIDPVICQGIAQALGCNAVEFWMQVVESGRIEIGINRADLEAGIAYVC